MTDQPQDLGTTLLDILGKLIIPDWGALIALMPLGVMLLVLLIFAVLAMRWRRVAAIDRSRVPRRLGAGAPPAGVHLPGPSRWPFVVPIGGALILFAIAVRPAGANGAAAAPVNVPVLLFGLLVLFAAIVGWLRDAMTEWSRTDGGVHTGGSALMTLSAPTAPPLTMPPGVHLPGPSPWPFFAPIALMMLLFGLVLSPLLVVAGLIMFVIAAVGWYRDAGSEFRQVEAGHAPEPVTRDPERAWPRRVVRVYLTIAAIAVVLVVAPSAISRLSSAATGGAGGSGAGSPGASAGTASTEVHIVAKGIAFTTTSVQAVANKPLTITFDNQDSAPHNVAIMDAANALAYAGEIFAGPKVVTYKPTPPLKPGSYHFVCQVHPNMTGTLDVR